MANAELNVTLREEAGKGVARKLRAEGLVPAVVYGKGFEPCTITVEPKALDKAVSSAAGWNTLITLKGAKPVEGKVVVLKDLKRHAIRRTMVCADFHAIDLKKKGHFMVPVVTVGTSAGQKAGGLLQILRHELEVICLPDAVPQSISVDVAALEIGDVIHVAEIAAPEGTEIPYDANFTILTVAGHKPEVEEVEGEEVEGEEAGEE
jgi:large subunit ribosomal protein L25